MFIDYLFEIIKSGGWVLFPILIVGAGGFFFVAQTIYEMGGDYLRRNYEGHFDQVIQVLAKGEDQKARQMLAEKPGIVSHGLQLAIDHRAMDEKNLLPFLTQKLHYQIGLMDRHLPMLSILASVAPLLGLLGTVIGMVHTFQIITEYGNSNPILLADGISEALITTQSGLLIAFPLVLFKHQLEDHIEWLKKQVELRVTQYLNVWYHPEGNSNHG